jgi:hypothetical protein
MLYNVYFCCILEKNTNKKHISGAPFLLPVAHPIHGAPKWGAPQIYIMSGAPHLGAPQIGHITVAHEAVRHW